MTRFFVTLGWIMLLLLLVDSAMNDQDVKPVVDHQFQRAGETLLGVVGWFRAQDAESAGIGHATHRDVATQVTLHDSPASNWYWSTMLAAAVVALRRAKLTQAFMPWVRPVADAASRNWDVSPAVRRA